jgi:hypothetical protein
LTLQEKKNVVSFKIKSWQSIPNSGHLIPESGRPIRNSGHLIPDSGRPIPNSDHQIPMSGHGLNYIADVVKNRFLCVTFFAAQHLINPPTGTNYQAAIK